MRNIQADLMEMGISPKVCKKLDLNQLKSCCCWSLLEYFVSLWDSCLSALAELLLPVDLKEICKAAWEFSLYFWYVFVVQWWCHTARPCSGSEGSLVQDGQGDGSAGIMQQEYFPWQFCFHWKNDEREAVGAWGLWKMQKWEQSSRFWGVR